jgi:hypothetical protein
LFYKNKQGQMQMEVVTSIPTFDASDTAFQPFKGTILVEKWNGDFIKGFINKNGKTYLADSVPDRKSAGGRYYYYCLTTDYYTCVTMPGASATQDDCTYNYSETVCSSVDGGGGTGAPGGDTGGGTIDVYEDLTMGNPPLAEFANKCQGLQFMWNKYPSNEVFGYITQDGQLIVTNILGYSIGGASVPVAFNGKMYYGFQDAEPTLTYQGMLPSSYTTPDGVEHKRYYIPVVASVHTHTPCRSDGTDGVSQEVSSGDQNFAALYPQLNNWVIGCNAIAQYNSNNSSFFNVHSGSLSSTCNLIQ